jgi:hypothetical protein
MKRTHNGSRRKSKKKRKSLKKLPKQSPNSASNRESNRASNRESNRESNRASNRDLPERYSLSKKSGIIEGSKRNTYEPRNLVVVHFGKLLDITSEYDGKRRVFLRDHLPFYQTTATSNTNAEYPWLKETWLPCFGVGTDEHVFKLSGLNSPRGTSAKWPHYLSQEMILQEKLKKTPLYIKDPPVKKDEKEIEEDVFFKVIAARCPSWSLLRISAKIGEGVWASCPNFKKFVIENLMGDDRKFKLDPDFLLSMKKTKIIKTNQVYEEREDKYKEDVLSCRLSDIPEFHIVEKELVNF